METLDKTHPEFLATVIKEETDLVDDEESEKNASDGDLYYTPLITVKEEKDDSSAASTTQTNTEKTKNPNLIHTPTGVEQLTVEVCPQLLLAEEATKLENDKALTCSYCEKIFRYQSNLRDHLKTHRGVEQLTVEVCPQSLLIAEEVTKLEKDKAALTCSYCEKSFRYQSHLRDHLRSHTGERPFVCNNCDCSFSKASNLKCHERIHSGEKPYICRECAKGFTESSQLKRHYRTHTGEKVFSCNMCYKQFAYSTNLKRHLLSHRKCFALCGKGNKA